MTGIAGKVQYVAPHKSFILLSVIVWHFVVESCFYNSKDNGCVFVCVYICEWRTLLENLMPGSRTLGIKYRKHFSGSALLKIARVCLFHYVPADMSLWLCHYRHCSHIQRQTGVLVQMLQFGPCLQICSPQVIFLTISLKSQIFMVEHFFWVSLGTLFMIGERRNCFTSEWAIAFQWREQPCGSTWISHPITTLKIQSVSTMTLLFSDLSVYSRWTGSCLWCNLRAICDEWKGLEKKFLAPQPPLITRSYISCIYAVPAAVTFASFTTAQCKR